MNDAILLLAFAGARDAVGASEVRFSIASPCTVGDLFARVCETYPALTPYKRAIRVAVNGTYANDGDLVTFGDEVALIPPVAGG